MLDRSVHAGLVSVGAWGMLHRLTSLAPVSVPALVLIAAIIVVQIILQVYALVDLSRRSAVKGGRKWVWALVIALGGVVGAILYLAAGRPAAAIETTGDAVGGRAAAARAAATLYGREGPE